MSFRNRRGFTLAETLVTVAIIAVLAAVIVPAVTQQLGKADAPSFNGSIGSLRTEITSFVSDVRRFPGKVKDLQTVPTALTDFDLSGNGAGAGAGTLAPLGQPYTAATVARWRGPYDNSGNTAGSIPLGYGWSTEGTLNDSLSNIVVLLTKTSADTNDAHELDVAIDGVGSGKNAGIIRWAATTAALIPANTILLHLMSSAR
jgi:prepilin-type N-terminal cleavage/methylation domain-containing protein